jgi:pilus assembly protein CpaC
MRRFIALIGLTEMLVAGTAAQTSPVLDGVLELHSAGELVVAVNTSIVLRRPEGLKRISIANSDIAEAAALSPTEVLLDGKSPGDTTLLLWDKTGSVSKFDVHVPTNTSKIDVVQEQLRQEVGRGVTMTVEEGTVFLRGTVVDMVAAERAVAIAGTLGKVVNLLRVAVPEAEPQILLKVRFANVDRSAASQLGINLFGLGNKGVGSSQTGQFGGPPVFSQLPPGSPATLSDLLNIFYYRPDIGVGAVLQALEAKNLAQILAEPNLLTASGRPASFLAGGEFPFPTIQGGAAGIGQITIQFKEFGIRLDFLPTITPRGTIHLTVTPEVSSLDYSNALTVNGFTVPGLQTKRVQTEVELANGQSFVIAGLLDNQAIENLNKIPGIGDIPVLGKLFQSRSVTRSHSELLVVVTPELVQPIPAGVQTPELPMPLPFLPDDAKNKPQNPAVDPAEAARQLARPKIAPIESIQAAQAASGAATAASGSSTSLGSTGMSAVTR